MRVLTVGLALAVLVARPAVAGRMLYATAATPSRIDGFCLRDDGSVAPTPSVRLELLSSQPRRMVVMDSALYVVEDNRVEVFKIGPKGGLSFLGRTPQRKRSGPRDIAFSPSKNMLYVPDRSRNRIIGHPLDAEGSPAADFTTCIQGAVAQGYQSLVVDADKLYVSSNGGNGRIEVFGINPDGSLFGPNGSPLVTDCREATTEGPRPDPTPPLSERRQIHDVKSFVISEGFLYAEDRGRRRIKAFRLQPDGNFPPPTIENPNKPKKKTWAKAESKTERVAQYQMIALHQKALIGTQFFHGRIDSYLVEAPGQIRPTRTKKRTNADLRFTPVRLQADQDVVYVAAGEFDRIIAYHLDPDSGVLRDTDPFSETDEQKGSFPNEVAIAVLTAGCGS